MYYGGAESWNLRDTHMFETLEHLLEARGPHVEGGGMGDNSHIGDARSPRWAAVQDEMKNGQLCRELFGDQADLCGFRTHSGTVTALREVDGEAETKRVRPSHRDSYERMSHDADVQSFCLTFGVREHEALRRALMPPRSSALSA